MRACGKHGHVFSSFLHFPAIARAWAVPMDLGGRVLIISENRRSFFKVSGSISKINIILKRKNVQTHNEN